MPLCGQPMEGDVFRLARQCRTRMGYYLYRLFLLWGGHLSAAAVGLLAVVHICRQACITKETNGLYALSSQLA